MAELAHLAHLRRGDARQAVAANDVHDHQFGAGLRRDARCPAHQGLRLRPTCDGDDDTFARLPGVGDLVLFTILLQRRVDLIGEPQQRQFAQRREVSTPEVVGQRCVDTLGRVDVAVGEPAPQRFRRDVDQLDLVGGAHDLVGHRFLLLDAGDLGDDVVEALQVLDVDRRDHRDARHRAVPRRPANVWGSCCRGCWCARVRRRARPVAARANTASTSSSGNLLPRYSMYCGGTISMPAISSAVFLRPCVSTTAATRSVPRSSRRWASPSIAKVLPTPGAAPR